MMITTLCTWAVCYDIDGKNYDDGQTRTSVTALFKDPYLAEDFISKCLPAETRSRFYVKRMAEAKQ